MSTKRPILLSLNDEAVVQLDAAAANLVDLVGRDIRTRRPNRSAVIRALLATADLDELRRYLAAHQPGVAA